MHTKITDRVSVDLMAGHVFDADGNQSFLGGLAVEGRVDHTDLIGYARIVIDHEVKYGERILRAVDFDTSVPSESGVKFGQVNVGTDAYAAVTDLRSRVIKTGYQLASALA